MGYVIYQPELRDLQDEIANLNSKFDTTNSTLGTAQSSIVSLQNSQEVLNSEVMRLNSTVKRMENRTWHEAFSIGASSDVTTNTFLIKGEWVRIQWTMLGEGSDSWIMITLIYSNGTGYAVRGSSGIFSSYACDLEIIDPKAEYYLEIGTYAVAEYSVVVWDYY